MATLLHNESRRLYSWWWDSHISPKNSKWLQENLTDMDAKVKAMIKLIEEDADSFARRAEMYYKKRPELMKLVEEFYRAYRALAERYDHATGELRQAHRTMAEAFPNQIPFSLSDDFLSSPSEAEPHTPEMPHPLRAPLDPDDLQKDALGLSSHSLASKRSGTYTDDSDIVTGRKGLKQLNEMFAEGRARKGLNFQEEDKKGPEHKLPGMSQKHKLEEKEKKIRSLQEELSKLSNENQSLNSRVSLESERAGKAETEVQTLHKFISEVELEKQAAFLRYQECLERVSNLEAEIARVQEDASRLSEKILAETTKLGESEERCLLMEGAKHSLQVEVDTLIQKTKMQGKEISEKDEELEKIKICMKEEQLFRRQAEESLLSLQNLHSRSQEEHKKLALELQNTAQTSKEMETIKSGLEDELQRIKSDNHRLAEEYLSAGLLIKNLKDEIFNLKEAKCGLEEEARLHLGERDALEQELCCLKEKIEDSERRYQDIISQVGSVGLNVGTIQSSVKDLQDENLKLKEIGKKEEDEKVVLLGRLQDMEKLLQKNSLLESSLLAANVELDGLQEKIRKLEESFKYVQEEKSCLLTEKDSLVCQVEKLIQSTENLSEKNISLANSLADVNVELEALQVKSKGLEESCQSLQDGNSSLLIEKDNLASQVESIQTSLKEWKEKFVELEDKYSCLEEEKDLALHQVHELQVSLIQEKEEHVNFVQLSKAQLANLENQICLLQEVAKLSTRDNEKEHEKVLQANVEIFVLQSCIREMIETISFLSGENQKHVESALKAEKLILDLKKEICEQKEKMCSLLEENGELKTEIRKVSQSLGIVSFTGCHDKIEDQVLLPHILQAIGKMQRSSSKAEDEIQRLISEKSINTHLLEQLILENSSLKLERDNLEKDLETKSEELSILGDEKQKLLEMSEQLSENLKASHLQEEILKSETDVLSRQLSESEKAYQTLSNENFELLEENQSWKKEFCYLRDDKYILEEEYNVVLEESLTLSVLYLAAMSFGTEKSAELKWLYGNLDQLRRVNIDLKKEVGVMDAKIGRVEMENLHLKESMKKLEECRSLSLVLEEKLSKARGLNEESNRKSESLKIMLVQREMELSDALQKIKAKETENIDLCKATEALKEADKVAQTIREDLEKKIVMLSKDKTLQNEEIVCLREANVHLDQEMSEFQKEYEELKTQEKHLKFELLQMVDEAELSEVIAADLHKDLQISNVRSAIFEEKVYELLGKYEKEVVDQKTRNENLKSELQEKVDESEVWETEAAELYRDHQTSSTHAAIFEHKVYKLIQELQEEVVVQKTRNENLKSELQEKVSEAEVWETEAAELYRDLQTSSTCAAICEHKVYELTQENGNLAKSAMIQKEMLEKESALKEAEIKELKRKVGALEGENEGFRIELTAVVRLVSILGDSLSFLEEQANSLAKINKKDDQEPQEPEAVNHQDETNTQAPEEHNVSEPSKILELQKLQVKVQVVEKALVEIRRLSMQERSIANSNLEAAMKEIEELKSKSSGPLEVQPSKDIVVQLEEGGTEPRKDLVLREDEAKVSDVKMKDIQLDHVSNSSSYENGVGSYAKSRREKIKAEDQILELWEPAEQNGIPRPNIKNSDKVTSETTEDPVGSYRSESLEDQNFEKEMPVDKLEVPNKRMIERLASDAQRLTNLQTNMQELKHKIETNDKGTQLTGFEYDSLKGQLYEVEQTISQCVEINCKLTKNVEKEHSLSPNRKLEGLEETGHSGRKVLERARRCSEKIGRLELEMQRIQFVLFKLEDEYQSKARKEVERRRRVLLRDYLYGGIEGQRKKRRPSVHV